jgi:competence protein ComEA
MLKARIMKRTIFFWLDKLKISRTERRAVSYLLMLLVGMMLINTIIRPSASFDESRYQELDKQFRHRIALMKEHDRQIEARYDGRITGKSAMNDFFEGDTIKSPKEKSVPGVLVNINTAGEKSLQQLNGIGASYAARIIAYRQENGLFTSKEQLLNIKGIGKTRFENIRSLVTLGDVDSLKIARAGDKQAVLKTDEPSPDKVVANEQPVINVNAADAATLQKLPGIGPAYAERIVQYRQQNGSFQTKEELLKIKGIGKKRLANIKPFIKLTAQQ